MRTVRKAASVVVAAVLITAMTTLAAPAGGNVDLGSFVANGGNNSVWQTSNTANPYDGVFCGALTASAFTPVVDGVLDGNVDAFDDGGVLFVNGRAYQDTDGVAPYTKDVLTTKGGKFSKVSVSRKDAYLQATATLRTLIRFSNRTARSRTLNVKWWTNLGSDNQTIVYASSNGGYTTIEDTDHWVVTADSSTDGGLDDPPVLHVLWGKKGPVHPVDTGLVQGECLATLFKVKVPPRDSRYLLFFLEMHQGLQFAVTSGGQGYSMADPSDWKFDGLSPKVRARIVNWKL